MEPESNAMPQCRSGCGFYGNPSQDGLCSVCYKEVLRKKQQPPVSSTPSSNNGPQPPASGQSMASSAVSLRSVVVTQQSLAISSNTSSTTTTSASSASATSSSPSPSTCAAAANNPAVAVTNTAQPTVHSSLFCSDVKNAVPSRAEEVPSKSICPVHSDEKQGRDEEDAEDYVHDTIDPPLCCNGEAIRTGSYFLVFDNDCEDGSSSDNESEENYHVEIVVTDDEEAVDDELVEEDAEEKGFGTASKVESTILLSVHKSMPLNGEGSRNTKKRKLNTDDSGSIGGHSSNSSIADNDEKDGDKDDSKKKKNRCATCRKKVGLTGFECRCGGLFCAIHRYSDKHECSFDYRELGAAEIRRNNPVVVGEKIQKI